MSSVSSYGTYGAGSYLYQEQLYNQQAQSLSGLQAILGGAMCSGLEGMNLAQAFAQPQPPVKEKTMFQEVKNDVSTFIKTHRGVIYFIALSLLIDHFLFKGVFKARLQAMLESLIAKVETKVAEAK